MRALDSTRSANVTGVLNGAHLELRPEALPCTPQLFHTVDTITPRAGCSTRRLADTWLLCWLFRAICRLIAGCYSITASLVASCC